MNEAELELKMDDLGATGNDKDEIRFAHAWWRFKARFKSGHRYTAGDVYDAFEAGVAHGKQYDVSPVALVEGMGKHVFKAAPNHELGGDRLCVRCGGELYDLDRHYTYEEARARRSNIY